MTQPKRQTKAGVGKPKITNGRISDLRNLRGGYFAPRWLYFHFYLFCRRQAQFPERNKNLNPTFSAWSGLGAIVAIPWLVLVLTVDHFIPFLHSIGREWVALHLSGEPNKAWGYAWFVVGSITWIGLFVYLFGWRYESIMHEFSAFDYNEHIIVPNIILSLVWFVMMAIAGHAIILYISGSSAVLLNATLSNICIFIVAEIIFRL